MRHQAGTDIEAVQLVQIIVGLNRGKLKDLNEGRLKPSRLGIVEYESHSRTSQRRRDRQRMFTGISQQMYPHYAATRGCVASRD